MDLYFLNSSVTDDNVDALRGVYQVTNVLLYILDHRKGPEQLLLSTYRKSSSIHKITKQLFLLIFTIHVTGFPVIDKYTNQVKSSIVLVKWMPPLQGQCPVHAYSIYYKNSAINWTSTSPRMLPKNSTTYHLQLFCRTAYQIAMTAWNSNGESSLKDSRVWKVTTGGGNVHMEPQGKSCVTRDCLAQIM